jgi:hypothetical protein
MRDAGASSVKRTANAPANAQVGARVAARKEQSHACVRLCVLSVGHSHRHRRQSQPIHPIHQCTGEHSQSAFANGFALCPELATDHWGARPPCDWLALAAPGPSPLSADHGQRHPHWRAA